RLVTLAGWTLPVGRVLWGALALDGVIAGLFLVFYLRARRAAPAAALVPVHDPQATAALTDAERWMQRLLLAFGVLFGLSAVGYELGALLPAFQGFFVELPFVS